jgi:hypothetical protein
MTIKDGAELMWLLTLIFVCCGMPQSVTLPQNFATLQACDKAGQVWLQPNSNPDGTVRTFRCSPRLERGEIAHPSERERLERREQR